LLEENRKHDGFVNAQESVQMLLDMQDASAAASQLASAFMSTEMMSKEEKRAEAQKS
jgi:hypothetical protein